MKKLLLLFIVFSHYTQAQKSISGKIEDLTQLKNRDLIVVLFDDRAELIADLKKDLKKAKKEENKKDIQEMIEYNTKLVENVNAIIKEIVPKYWESEKNITYMTEKELFKLSKKKIKKYAVLYFRDENRELSYYNPKLGVPSWDSMGSINVPQFIFTGSETKITGLSVRKPKYMLHMLNVNYNFGIDKTPFSKTNKTLEKYENNLDAEKPMYDRIFSKENMITTLRLAKKHIDKSEELNKNLAFDKYLIMDALEHCGKLDGKEVKVQQAIIHKKIIENPSDYYKKGKIKMVTAKEIADDVIGETDTIIAFPILKTIVKSGGTSSGPISFHSVRGLYTKLLYNTATAEVYAAIRVAGVINYSEFVKKDFKKINECKF